MEFQIITPLNALRFVNETDRASLANDNYYYDNFENALQFDAVDSYDTRKAYFQKWNKKDTAKVQILSDYDILTNNIKAELYNCKGSLVSNIVISEIANTLEGQTFTVLQFEIPFLLVAEGYYYVKVSYTDNIFNEVVYLSEPFHVKDSHEGTILFEYTNSENNFDFVFDPLNIFSIRIEGAIRDFTPASDDVIYNDQKHNATKLYSIPFRTFKLYIGNVSGIPDWLSDKINWVLSCDQVKMDGVYYERLESSKYEVKRFPDYKFSSLEIEIQPVENKFLRRLSLGEDPEEGFKYVQKSLTYLANSANLAISGIFKKYNQLEYIAIINYGGSFTLNVGTTSGGTEFGSFLIDQPRTVININEVFDTPTTIYLSGLTGTNADILVSYLDYLAKLIGTSNPYSSLGIGACCIYEGTTEQIAVDWNLSTGLGKEGTSWEGWVIRDGRNGTYNMGGKASVGLIQSSPKYGTLGAPVGSETVLLDVNNLPPHDHPVITGGDNFLDNGGVYIKGKQNPDNNVGNVPTGKTGGNVPHDNVSPAIVELMVKKIA